MSSFGKKNKILRLLANLVGIETVELLGLSTDRFIVTTDNRFVLTTTGDFIKDSN